MVGTAAGPLIRALDEAEPLTTAGSAALKLAVAEGFRLYEAGVEAAALTGPGDLAGVEPGSGERVGGVGEEEALSAAMDARGGKFRRTRYSST